MELASPITIYWDLPKGSKNTDFHRRICSDILACRPLMLQLYFPDIRQDDGRLELLELLNGAQIAVTLTVPVDSPGNYLVNTGLKELLVSVECLDNLSGVMKSQALSGISYSVNRENWRQLPELVKYCRNNDVNRLVLPMQRLINGEIPFFITRHEQLELGSSLVEAGGSKDLNLTIHDPFLWRAFNPEIAFPQAGCQAANTMIYIDPTGTVYPCPTLAVSLGTVGELSLKEVIESPAKKEFRRRLLEAPEDCRGCEDLFECRGGCRGRALALHASFDGIDSACQ